MIHANPDTGNASEDAVAPEGYTLQFSTPAEYEAWKVANDFVVTPPADVPRVEQIADVTNQQLRLALIDAGIMPSAILAQLNAMPTGADKERALAAWEYANTFRRDHQLVSGLALQMCLTSEQVDNLFRLAATLG